MFRAIILLAVCVFMSGYVTPSQAEPLRAADAPVLYKAFIMTVAEDGKPLRDYFEVWDTHCVVKAAPREQLACSITVLSLAESGGETFLSTWTYDAESIWEIKRGVFRIDMYSPLTGCSRLSIIVQFNYKRLEVESLEADMRSGTRCQSRRTFSLDRVNRHRTIAPLYNPAFR